MDTITMRAIAILLLLTSGALARDLGQWENMDPQTRAWFNGLKQPDNPTVSCCGESDGYEADDFKVRGDEYVAIVTDTRPDEPLRRPHIAPGTEVSIPKHKIKFDNGNPSGHGWLFIGQGGVYCYLPPVSM